MAGQLHRIIKCMGYFTSGAPKMGKLDSLAFGRFYLYSLVYFSRQTFDSITLWHIPTACIIRASLLVPTAGLNFYPYFCMAGGTFGLARRIIEIIIWDVHLVVPNQGGVALLPVAKAMVPAAHQGVMP